MEKFTLAKITQEALENGESSWSFATDKFTRYQKVQVINNVIRRGCGRTLNNQLLNISENSSFSIETLSIYMNCTTQIVCLLSLIKLSRWNHTREEFKMQSHPALDVESHSNIFQITLFLRSLSGSLISHKKLFELSDYLCNHAVELSYYDIPTHKVFFLVKAAEKKS